MYTKYFKLVLILLIFSCQTEKKARWQEESFYNFESLKEEILRHDPSLHDFEEIGPFPYEIKENIEIPLKNKQSILADFISPKIKDKSPLVIIVHGNRSAKEAHREQAVQLASYGTHVLTLQMPNRHQWIRNGRVIASLTKKIARNPKIIDRRINQKNIVLIGHSFGGSAITIAAGLGAPIQGLILLDPAVVSPRIPKYMQKVADPTILFAADKNVYRARKQHQFYRYIQGNFAQVSITGATHDDAQSPSMFSRSALGIDPYTSKTHQQLFRAAIVGAAMSIFATRDLDWIWSAFREEEKSGRMKEAQRKL